MKSLVKTVLYGSLVAAFFIPLVSFAQTPSPTNYDLLAPIPLNGANNGVTDVANANNYITGIFILIIGIATVLAVVMIIFGGIKYMSTDAFSGKSEAKETIQNALVGLLLAIGAWIILYTISPKLLTFNLSLTQQPITQSSNTVGGTGGAGPGICGGGICPGYTLSAAQVTQNASIVSQLGQNQPPVTVNNPPCTNGGTSGCTNVVGLPSNAISGVMNLAASCMSSTGSNCFVQITGGAEGGHQTHAPNVANVDLGLNNALTNYITQNGQPVALPAQCGVPSLPHYNLSGIMYVNEGNHWHVCY